VKSSSPVVRLLGIGAALAATVSLLTQRNSSRGLLGGYQPASHAAAPIPEKAAAGLPKQPADAVVGREIDRAIDDSELAQARWGVFVMSLNDGRVIYSRNGDRLFTPASNMKVYTTAVALDLLGAGYRWRTSVYANKEPNADGVIDGDLVLYGRGAPDLDSDRKDGLPALAHNLYERGVRRVRGAIVGEQSYFRGDLYGDGWQWTDLQWYFGTEPSALTVNANAFQLTITAAGRTGVPAALQVKPATEYVRLQNETTTVERSAPPTIGINRGLSDNEVRVWGEFPSGSRGFSAYMSVYNPALWAAILFKEALVSSGIQVEGEARSRDFRVSKRESFDPQLAIELATIESKTLAEVVRSTNKESINLNAELILRTLGKERGAMAPDPDPRKMRQRGDDQAGSAVIKLWLERAAIPTKGIAIRDGSGLSRLDLVSPEITARLLIAIAKTNSYQPFRDSLPIAGRDGTMAGRLRHESGRVIAKTGTLTYDHSLSGYAVTQANETLVFSIFCNDAAGSADPRKVIDKIAAILVASSGR